MTPNLNKCHSFLVFVDYFKDVIFHGKLKAAKTTIKVIDLLRYLEGTAGPRSF